ncbi:MAG TPA: hypothetical protein VM030_11715 [Acidimicrobiales bacterium]|nr:hypothetical protein [Acidimicrobiales bacterium]
MKKRALYVAAATITAAAVVMQGGPASAADGGGATSAVTATITAGAIGSRSITAASPIAMTSSLDSTSLSGSLTATVTEAARSGTNPWSVTATMSDLTNVATDVLSKANMAVSGRSVIKTAGGGTAAAPAGSSNLDAAVTLFSTTGQSAGVVYTGSYASSSTWTLAVPNATATGVYSGTVTLTLVQ